MDGLVALALGFGDPLGPKAKDPRLPAERTEAYWRASYFPPTRAVRGPWRDQTHELIRTVSFAGDGSGRMPVPYGTVPDDTGGPGQRIELPLRDPMVDRAFECWIHAGDIAHAVDYPYDPPSPRHLHRMIDLAARMLPGTLAGRRRSGLAASRDLVAAGAPGRSLRLEIEGLGGGESSSRWTHRAPPRRPSARWRTWRSTEWSSAAWPRATSRPRRRAARTATARRSATSCSRRRR
ncbi:hypothetical protein SALBM135S_05386 [Streptomyces alboniger]